MSGYSHKITATQSIGEKFQSFVPAKMGIGLKSLTLIAATLIFVLFSFLPTWQLFGNFPSQLAVAAPASSAQVGTIPDQLCF
ncbi:MAG: hypothetical protein GDA44_07540 [Prochloron sp. SP5CPC1]|nr:hypothetical protein [Candidatus Paraprochloron terpiosi SP5CPC1]